VDSGVKVNSNQKTIQLSRFQKATILFVVSMLIIIFSDSFSYVFAKPLVELSFRFFVLSMGLQMIFYVIYATAFHLFNRVYRFFGVREIAKIIIAGCLTGFSEYVGLLSFSQKVSFRYIFLANVLTIGALIIVNMFWCVLSVRGLEVFLELFKGKKVNLLQVQAEKQRKRVIIIGAGSAGFQLIQMFQRKESKQEFEVFGFVDDDPNKVGVYVSDKKVLGVVSQFPLWVQKYDCDQLILAIPSLSFRRRQEIINLALEAEIKIVTMPNLEDVAFGKLSVNSLKDVDVVDLLSREEVKLDADNISRQLRGKAILVTGAGGSIGSEIVRQLLPFKPAKLFLLGHGEHSIYKIHEEICLKVNNLGIEVFPIIADVENKKRLEQVFEDFRPEIVYHAAAYKHVPLMEENPIEAVSNNIYGTLNVAKIAKRYGIENFVLISTDKAVNPTNVMGATKRIAEMAMLSFNEMGKTKFSAVRFGNVLGSRGSVVPLFKRQIASGGPVTVTDFRMTRYFMTISEASRLVLQSGALAKGGEIFVLDMGKSVKIKDLAVSMIRLSGRDLSEISVEETGIRPGEKLYEELFLPNEKNLEQIYNKIFVSDAQNFDLNEIQGFLQSLPSAKKELAKQVVEYANGFN